MDDETRFKIEEVSKETKQELAKFLQRMQWEQSSAQMMGSAEAIEQAAALKSLPGPLDDKNQAAVERGLMRTVAAAQRALGQYYARRLAEER